MPMHVYYKCRRALCDARHSPGAAPPAAPPAWHCAHRTGAPCTAPGRPGPAKAQISRIFDFFENV